MNMSLNLWHCPTEGTYIVIQKDFASLVVPSEDIMPHNLESMECQCKPNVHYSEGIHVVHNRYSDVEAVDDSIKKLFGK